MKFDVFSSVTDMDTGNKELWGALFPTFLWQETTE